MFPPALLKTHRWMGWGLAPARCMGTAPQTPCPYHRGICAPMGNCIPLSSRSCPEHLCPSHPWDGDRPPGLALRQAIIILPNLPSSLKTLAPRRWLQQPMEQPAAPGRCGGTTCFPLPAGCLQMLEAPGGTGHPGRLSQSHR